MEVILKHARYAGAATARQQVKAEPSGHHGKVADVLWFALETKAETIRNCPVRICNAHVIEFAMAN